MYTSSLSLTISNTKIKSEVRGSTITIIYLRLKTATRDEITNSMA